MWTHEEITFQPLTLALYPCVMSWMKASHVQEFWDMSTSQANDMENFAKGKKDGLMDYWVGHYEDAPYSLLLSSDLGVETPLHYVAYLSPTGKTFSIDFMIGNVDFLGKGLAVLTLQCFIDFLQTKDPAIDRFIIDPAARNTRAHHVYQNAGFKDVGIFTPTNGFFRGLPHSMMLRCKE